MNLHVVCDFTQDCSNRNDCKPFAQTPHNTNKYHYDFVSKQRGEAKDEKDCNGYAEACIEGF